MDGTFGSPPVGRVEVWMLPINGLPDRRLKASESIQRGGEACVCPYVGSAPRRLNKEIEDRLYARL